MLDCVGVVLDMVLGAGFGRFWEGENHGFGLTPVFASLLPVFASFGIAKSRRMVEFQFCIS